jgi:hypothetical protein
MKACQIGEQDCHDLLNGMIVFEDVVESVESGKDLGDFCICCYQMLKCGRKFRCYLENQLDGSLVLLVIMEKAKMQDRYPSPWQKRRSIAKDIHTPRKSLERIEHRLESPHIS